MKKWIFFSLLSLTLTAFANGPFVIDHNDIPSFQNNGNTLKGIATAHMGIGTHEVWKSSIAPGCCTPKHQHEVEEITIFFKGKGKAVIGEEVIYFEAPCTLILPPFIDHQIFNTGDEPTDHIAILQIGSKIVNAEGQEMRLPWR
ncbi:MAG: cupin domain-containing protein [Simkania sp.]|nr:cupin domain-containing protein [Simkania sp.]MCB1075884.1 cupin domain-containing protein [Simkania sp.]MCP5490632.1 cupin domain-containing protein [Chlamydiales bacterium]